MPHGTMNHKIKLASGVPQEGCKRISWGEVIHAWSEEMEYAPNYPVVCPIHD